MRAVIRIGENTIEHDVVMAYENGRLCLRAEWHDNGHDCSLTWWPRRHEGDDERVIVHLFDEGDTKELMVFESKEAAEQEYERRCSHYCTPPKVERYEFSTRDAELILGQIIGRRMEDLRARWAAVNLVTRVECE